MQSLFRAPQTFLARVPVDPAWHVTADVVGWVRVPAGGDGQSISFDNCLTSSHTNVVLDAGGAQTLRGQEHGILLQCADCGL